MRIVTLFGVRVKHDYYSDAVCRDLSFEPTAKTRRLIDGHRLLLRELPDGFSVSALTGADGKSALIALPRDEMFVFHLCVRNPAFALFTDLQEFAGNTDPVYTNAALAAADGTTLTLSERKSWNTETIVVAAGTTKVNFTLAGNPLALDGDALTAPQPADFSIVPPAGSAKVTAYDAAAKTVTISSAAANQRVTVRYRAQTVADRKILADVELRYDESMPELGKDDAAFEIKFKARAARWAYYLITDQTGDFSIIDSNASGPPLGFSAKNRTLLNKAADETDQFAMALSRQYAEFQRVRFLSDQPVPCSSAARRGIELRLGGQKVLEAMPNPSIRHLSRIKQKLGAALQEQDTFHQLIQYLKAY